MIRAEMFPVSWSNCTNKNLRAHVRERGFPGVEVKNPPAKAVDRGDLGLIPGREDSLRSIYGNSTPVLLPSKSHGWRSLATTVQGGSKELTQLKQLRHAGKRVTTITDHRIRSKEGNKQVGREERQW